MGNRDDGRGVSLFPLISKICSVHFIIKMFLIFLNRCYFCRVINHQASTLTSLSLSPQLQGNRDPYLTELQ